MWPPTVAQTHTGVHVAQLLDPKWLSKPLFYKIPASIHGLPWGTGMAASLRNARVGWHSPPSLAQSQLLDSELTFAFLFPLGDVSQDQRLCSGQPPRVSAVQTDVHLSFLPVSTVAQGSTQIFPVWADGIPQEEGCGKNRSSQRTPP